MAISSGRAAVATAVEAPPRGAPERRLAFVDNLRWVMIILVVLMHLKVTYGDMGLWYYIEGRPAHPLSMLFFGVYGSFVQAFCMGLLFFVAGLFVPGSCDRKGAGRFARERLIRLGVPSLVYMLLIHPVTVRIAAQVDGGAPPLLPWYGRYLGSLAFLSNSGPLWFALALLVFSLVYAGWHWLSSGLAPGARGAITPTHAHVLAVIALISVLAFPLRSIVPAGVQLLDTQPGNFMQLGFFASYVVLFVLGIVAARRDVLAGLSYRLGRRWFLLAWIVGVPAWLLLVTAGGIARDPAAFFGGLHWQAAAYATWESFFCVGISLGLLTIFREKHDAQGALARFLSANAFGVYVFHPPILVAITIAFRGVEADPLVKMLLAAVLVLPACFAFSHLVRRVPLLARLFT